ncbi:hypothetical protein V6N12_065221 [Hibiscus sabdariffa]|uniref:Uncharacterized protein n=1 Tax=Hibiscus sabdariffa TaxID=183260 RepID=A0ABR2G824_9ROSI
MKPQKTKQLSVAIAEASSAGEDAFAKQQAQTTPRKRGRPRKIVEKTESQEQKEAIDSQTKEARITEEEQVEQKPHAKAEASSMAPRRRRRRKSKPRKSS